MLHTAYVLIYGEPVVRLFLIYRSQEEEIHVSFWKKLFAGPQVPPASARQLSRNASCWCGSDKKYKQCHFEADQGYFTAQQNAACKGPT